MSAPPSTRPDAAHPLRELARRYAAVFAIAWQHRHELAGPARHADEAAFLPAALSLQETPVHPAPRRFALAICALFVAALAWACLGHVDIVAVASGRIVVSQRTKTLQPLETSVVRQVRVKNGDAVSAGQVLVELDATNALADGATLAEQWRAAASDERHSAALLEALRLNRAPDSQLPSAASAAGSDGDPNTQVDTPFERGQLQAEWADVSARLARLGSEVAQRDAQLATARAAVAKLEATLPLARQREVDVKSLSAQGFMSGHAGQDRERERIIIEQDLLTERARLAEAMAAQRESVDARSAYLAETRRALGERQARAALKRQQLTQERSKADQRQRLTQLVAPVAGIVQQVAVHTEGGVVTPAQVLMVIVPRDALVTAEVVIDNKDIGFVNAGQAAVIKLETFPYTRYGTVGATVSSVSADAVTDEQRGAIFPAVLALQQTSIDVDGKRIGLSPGMNLSAEITTGQRRVIDYLLSPVRQAMDESLRER
jgi:hemolysin D